MQSKGFDEYRKPKSMKIEPQEERSKLGKKTYLSAYIGSVVNNNPMAAERFKVLVAKTLQRVKKKSN